jgi:Rps23 Pro-64 3,4-dihydroxylase Tpa1-like proline 4-hydroxylase
LSGDPSAYDGGISMMLEDVFLNPHLEVSSSFNILVVMNTHRESLHSVNSVKVDGKRLCVSN